MAKRHLCSICNIRLISKEKQTAVHLSLSDKQHRDLKEAAALVNMTMASYVRHAIHDLVEADK